MTALAVLAALAAFALLGLSTEGHHRRWRGGYLTPRGRRLFRAAAWTLVAVTAMASVAARGWVFGPILAFALVMLAAGVVFLVLNLAPVPWQAGPKGIRR